MANIGTLAVNVIAQTGKFTAGMQGARKTLNSFAAQTKLAAASTAGFAGGILALGAGAGLAALTKNAFDNIDATGKLSKRLNIATEDLIGFQHGAGLAGVSSEQLTTGMEKFVKNIGDVRAGGGAAADTFAMLGLSADELANMDTGQAIRLVSDEIDKLPTAADKASAATKLFGKSGATMLQLLEGGSGTIDEMRADAEKLGKAYSNLDSDKVEGAVDAFDRLQGTIGGAFQKMAIEFAPAITDLANKMTDFVTAGDGLKSWMPTFGGVAKVVGVVADVVDVFGDTFKLVQSGITQDIGLLVRGIGYIGYALQETINLIPGMEVAFTNSLFEMADGLDQLAQEQFAEAEAGFMARTPSENINNWLDEVTASTKKVTEAVTDGKKHVDDFMGAFEANEIGNGIVESLQEQVDWFGFSADEIKLWKLATSTADQATIDLAFALTEEKSALHAAAEAAEKQRSEMESMRSEGISLMESLRSPMEQFESTMDDMFRLQDVGAIGETTFNRAAEKAKMDLADSMVMPTVPTGAAAIDARSAEGISRLRQQNKDPMKDAIKVAEEQLEIQKMQHVAMKEIAKNTSATALVGVSIP